MQQRHEGQHPQPKIQDEATLLTLLGASSLNLKRYGVRQLREMESTGAKLAETIHTPIVIKNPLPHSTNVAILTSRWLGGGVFGAVLTLSPTEFISTLIPIQSALAANPTLTPSGTIENTGWDNNLSTKLTHLLPRHLTLLEAAWSISQEVSPILLDEFPDRVDLTKGANISPQETAKINEIAQAAIDPLQQELLEGLKLIHKENEKARQLNTFIATSYSTYGRRIMLEHALEIFRDTRLNVALVQFKTGASIGPIHELIEQASEKAALVATSAVREWILNGLCRPPGDLLRRPIAIGLRAAISNNKQFEEIWGLLDHEAKVKICTFIGERAWQKAVPKYAITN